MVDLSDRSARMARAEVARWFATLPSGPVFLDREGRAIPLAVERARTLRAVAEEAAAQAAAQLEWRAIAAVFGTLIVVVVGQSLANAVPAPADAMVRAITYALYVAHAVWAIVEAVNYQRALRRLRDAVAHEVRGQAPLPAAMAGPVTNNNAIFGIIAAIVFVVAALTVLAEVSDHNGMDLIRYIPGWVPLAAVGLIYALVFFAKWRDRRRGIGVLPAPARPFDRYRRADGRRR